MAPKDLDKLLVQLVRDGALEVIDPTNYAGRDRAPNPLSPPREFVGQGAS